MDGTGSTGQSGFRQDSAGKERHAIEYLVLITTAVLIVALLLLGLTRGGTKGFGGWSGSNRKSGSDWKSARGRGSDGMDGSGPMIYPEGEEKKTGGSSGRRYTGRKAEVQDSNRGFHRCPLCGTVLEKREKVKSVLYPGKPDGMMEIYGCPYCYGPRAQKERICPVCKKPVPKDGLVYARFFQTSERKHAHVLGCSNCYTRH